MDRRLIVLIVIVIAVFGLGYCSYSRYVAQKPEATPQAIAEEEIVQVVSASGEVRPAKWAKLSFKTGGLVERLAVEEGDEVEAGQLLIQLETTNLEQAVAQAEAAVAAAEAELAHLKAGARPEEVAAAEEAVAAAQANYAAAKAELAQLKAGPKEEEIIAAKATMEKAKVAMELAQAEYDKIAWVEDIGATPQAVALQQATADYWIAKANYDALLKGATAEEIAVAEAAVDGARAQVREAQARLDLLRAGATAEEIAAAEARVAQAEAALAQTRSALEDASLKAPFAGTVAMIAVKEGELVAAGLPVVTIGDLSHLRVETTDLNEIDIAKVSIGQKVDLTFDALPERRLSGRVSRIAPMATPGQGGTNYTVIIELDELDPALRWGMTAFVDIVVGQ